MQTNREQEEMIPTLNLSPQPEEQPFVSRTQGINTKWWLAMIGGLAFVGAIVFFVMASLKSDAEHENASLSEKLKTAEAALIAAKAAAPAVAPIVKVDETPKAKVVEPEKLRIVVAASYAYDDPLDKVKIDGLTATLACQSQFSGLSFRVTNAKTANGTSRVIIVERNVGMDEDDANLVAACIEGKIIGAQKPMVKNPKLYRKDSL